MPTSAEKLLLASMDVAERHPVQFICLDRVLQGNGSLRVNALETFRSPQPEARFHTV